MEKDMEKEENIMDEDCLRFEGEYKNGERNGIDIYFTNMKVNI